METLTDIELAITSSAFGQGETIPSKYTCDGEDINPDLRIDKVPPGTKSLALIVEDPDAPGGTYDHWVVWNIDPETREIQEDSVPGIEGSNSFGQHTYGGPCPPDREHRYYFRIYALNRQLALDESANKEALLVAIEGNVLATGELMGRYNRND